eukprot:snap_masked-scaffold_43-processed-gene-1.90-mRNA-1 protein AED:0.02 eAED:0.02 QI:0/-1/0/1/-1/1/1/0/768
MPKVAKSAPKNSPDDYLSYGEGQWWTSDPSGLHKVQHSAKGLASAAETPSSTIPQLLMAAAANYPDSPALRTENMPPLKPGEDKPEPLPLEEWKTWTWSQYLADAKKVGAAMIHLGLEKFDSASILGFNSPEWALSMIGAILAGGKGAGLYPTDTPDIVQYKADHSNSSIAVVQNLDGMKKFTEVMDNLPYLKAIICYEADPGADVVTGDGRTIQTFKWEDFLKLGTDADRTELEARMKGVEPANCACLIYTSGTTGMPKAVMVSNDSMVYVAASAMTVSKVIGMKKGTERVISYLPLSHIAGLMIDLIVPIIVTANHGGLRANFCTHFARSYDLKLGTLVDRLKTVQPTMFLGVPRVWEKIMEKLKAVGASTKGIAKSISTYAKKRGTAYTSTRQLGGSGSKPKSMMVANLILGAIKKKLGLNKCKFMFSGAAPLTLETLEYFGSIGININEVYGMSETTGVVSWSTDEFHVWGSVGFEIPGTEVKIIRPDGTEAPAAKDLFNATEEEQGEICFRGRGMMMGYLANERLGADHVKEITAKNEGAIDKNGFIHSGDKGTRDARGMIKITGRYKELIIGAGGENIAPVPIEDELKRICPILSNVMMIGNKRKFNTMVVTLKAIGASGELPGGNDLAPPALGAGTAKTITEAMSDKAIIDMITAAIKTVNNTQSVVPSNAAKVQKFTILPRDFSVQTGELTATLKLKRSVAEEEFTPIIDKMYESADIYVNYESAPTPNLDMGPGAVPAPKEKNLSFNMGDAVAKAMEVE